MTKICSPVIQISLLIAILLSACSQPPSAAHHVPSFEATRPFAIPTYPISAIVPTTIPAHTASPTFTATPSTVPSITPTPIPLPSPAEIKRLYDNQVVPLISQIQSAPENLNLELPSDVHIIYVPQTERLHYIQSILGFTGTQATSTGNKAYLLYDYARGETLGYRQPLSFFTSSETQEILVTMRLFVEENGQYFLVELETSTGSAGSTSLQDLVQNAVQQLTKLPSNLSQVQADLQTIIGYACGIEMDPYLDYQHKAALLTFALTSDNWADRRQAIDAIGNLDPLPTEAAPALIAFLGDEYEVASVAEDALTKMSQDPIVLNLLLAAIDNSDPAIRTRLGAILSSATQSDASINALVTLLYDSDLFVRQAAKQGLSYSGRPSVIPLMITALKHENPDVRQAAAEVLQNYEQLAAPAVPDLTALLHDTIPEVRQAAAVALMSIGSQAQPALPELIKAAQTETNYAAFEAIIRSIAMLTSQAETLPLLKTALTHSESDIRQAACRILETYPGVPGVVELLIPILSDKDEYVRKAAMNALATFGSQAKRALPVLSGQAQIETDYVMYMQIIHTIAAIQSKLDTIPLLNLALTSNLLGIRRAACDILSTYSDVPGAVDALSLAIKDTDEHVRECAAEALAKFESESATSLPGVISAAQNETDPDAFKAKVETIITLSDQKTALPVLVVALSHEQPEIRITACELLADFQGFTAAVDALIPMLTDTEASVRAAAAEALGDIDRESRTSLTALVKAVGQELNREAFIEEVKAVAELSSQSDAYLLIEQGLSHSEAEIRKAACKSLITYQGIPGAVTALTNAMQDVDYGVRVAAVNSLYAFGPEAKSAVPTLLAALAREDDYHVWLGAMQALGEIGPDASPAVPALLSIIQKYGNEYESRLAIKALGGIGLQARSAVPTLMQFLNNISGNWSRSLTTATTTALAAITLQNFGEDIQQWNQWWALYQDGWE